MLHEFIAELSLAGIGEISIISTEIGGVGIVLIELEDFIPMAEVSFGGESKCFLFGSIICFA